LKAVARTSACTAWFVQFDAVSNAVCVAGLAVSL
jgi:hypothetical protein